jgi:hypothetical protein
MKERESQSMKFESQVRDEDRSRLPRREVMRYFAGAGMFLAAGGGELSAADRVLATKGYGTDPALNKIYKPGDAWPLTMSAASKKAATALADVILPADDLGPAASELRVADFIDEWVSAPYPDQQAVRPVILEGLKWIDEEAKKRFQKSFASLSGTQQRAICDDICDSAKAAAQFKTAAAFFLAFRSLAMGAYYATPEGWKAIGYAGNVVSQAYDGPPPEVLKKLGLVQTVK